MHKGPPVEEHSQLKSKTRNIFALLRSFLSALWRLLVAPIEPLPLAEDWRRAQVISGSLLLGVFSIAAEQVAAGNTPLAALVMLSGGYILSRTRWYKIAGLILIVTLTIPSYMVALKLQNPDPSRLISAFVWAFLPILVASLVYSVQTTTVISLLNVAAMFLLPFFNDTLNYALLSGAIGFFVVSPAILLIVMNQRDQIERDRRDELIENRERLEKEIEERILTQEILQDALEKKTLAEIARDKRTEALDKLNAISRSISTLQNMENVFEEIYQEVRAALDLDSFFIVLYDAQKNEFSYPFMMDEGTKLHEPNSYKRAGTHLDRCISNAEPVLIARSSVEMDEIYKRAERNQGDYLGVPKPSACIMYAPMIAQAQVIGAVSVQSYKIDAFNETSLIFLANVALQAAVAIENARLFEALQVSENLFRLAFHSSPMPFCITKLKDGVYLDVNEAYLRLIDYKREEVIGKSSLELNQWGQTEDREKMVERILHTGQENGLEEVVTTRLGEVRNVLVSYNLLNMNGENRNLTLFEDITDRRRAEIQKEEFIAELGRRNAELERFTYTVSHDLKSPLVTIKGFLGLLKNDIEQNNEARIKKDIDRIGAATEKMSALLSELLELSRVGRIVNPPERIPFAELVRDALEMVEGRLKEKNVKLTVMDELPILYGDRIRLREVLENLMDNAAKYIGSQPAPEITVGAQKGEEGLTVFVRDNGMGIDPRYHEKVFGLFEKLDAESEGTGIGLALIKRIIETHGGKIWVESDGEGKGSTFYFTLAEVIAKDRVG